MEKFKLLRKNGALFNVGNQGTIQVLDAPRGKFIKTFERIEQFTQTGGRKDSRYLRVRGHYVHRLVAEAWIGPIPENHEVNHRDGNKKNNEADNLEIVTHKENIKHSIDAGLKTGEQISKAIKGIPKTEEHKAKMKIGQRKRRIREERQKIFSSGGSL